MTAGLMAPMHNPPAYRARGTEGPCSSPLRHRAMESFALTFPPPGFSLPRSSMIHPLLQAQPPAGYTQWIALLVAVAAIAFVLFRGKRKKDPMQSGPRLSLSQQRSVEQQMSNLLVELSEMARQITSQLDSRATKLELLIREADEKIAAMKSMGNGAFHPAAPSPAQESFSPAPDAIEPPTPTSTPRPTTHDFPPDPRNEQVYAMADQGSTPQEIARQLGRPSGEVQLILALRGRP